MLIRDLILWIGELVIKKFSVLVVRFAPSYKYCQENQTRFLIKTRLNYTSDNTYMLPREK